MTHLYAFKKYWSPESKQSSFRLFNIKGNVVIVDVLDPEIVLRKEISLDPVNVGVELIINITEIKRREDF
jgi:hypothetical protein